MARSIGCGAPENSHQPTRRREQIMKRFVSPRHLQRFVFIHDPIASLYRFPRHSPSASDYRASRNEAATTWQGLAGTGCRA
jgi:putative transposase